MTRKLIVPTLIGFILFLTIPILYLANYSQTITTEDQKVVYELPYPGILPDHPLYFFKAIRDKILDFSTRDKLKKVDLYILFSDKRARMAQLLSDKGKMDQAITTMSKSEKYFLKIPKLLIQSKEQGEAPKNELIDRVKASNKKHREVIQELLKTAPEGEQYRITEILMINENSQNDLENLQ
ncbi:MAG: DUF5667 domain-containing protein [Patescibacteria group bacterium]